MRIALPANISAAAFADRDAAAPIVTLTGETMGTTWRVLFARPASADPASLRTAIAARLSSLVAEMSHWDTRSDLSRFNRAPAGRWHALAPDFATVMATAFDIAARTGGAFDPAIGRLVDLHGFGPPGPVAPPDAETLSAAARLSGHHRLRFDPGTRRLLQPGGLALDLSGIAKGHAVDAVAALLHAAGIRHLLVEIGGELSGHGIRPDGDPWWVDLEDPPETRLPPLRIALHGLAVATSGNYRRGDHNLDPRTGRPAAHHIVSASVLHASAMIADAWATALTVLGPIEGLALATANDLAARIVTQRDGITQEHLTPAMQAMLAD